MKKRDIYLTSTFRHPWNRAFNPLIGAELESMGITCFLPHRDTDQSGPPATRFSQDLAGIDNARMILAIAENESPNWGAEVGYAHGRGMPVIALAHNGHDTPLICHGMINETLYARDLLIFDDYIEDLIALIGKFRS